MTDPARALSNKRKKRGVVKASITRLNTRLAAVERLPDSEVRRLTSRLQALVEEFKVHHCDIIDLLDDDDELEREQEVFDNHDDEVAQLTACLEKLVSTCSSSDSNQPKIATKRVETPRERFSCHFRRHVLSSLWR